METISCKVCGGDNWKKVLETKDFLHDIPGLFIVARCTDCGFMVTNPRPDEKEIIAYYPDDYGPYQLNISRVEKMVAHQKNHPFLFSIVDPQIFQVVRKKCSDCELKILEIGCGAGNFLYELKLRFPKWNITGTDFSVKSIDKLKEKEIDAYVSDLKELPHVDKSLDVIYGYMIIEHLHNLEQTLREIKRILKDDGELVIAVPNIQSLVFRVFGKYSNFLHIPAHLYHFTESTLTKIMEQNGFTVTKVTYHRTIQDSAISLGYALRESGLPEGLKNLLLKICRWRILYHFITLPIAYIQSWTKQSPGMTIIFKKSA